MDSYSNKRRQSNYSPLVLCNFRSSFATFRSFFPLTLAEFGFLEFFFLFFFFFFFLETRGISIGINSEVDGLRAKPFVSLIESISY